MIDDNHSQKELEEGDSSKLSESSQDKTIFKNSNAKYHLDDIIANATGKLISEQALAEPIYKISLSVEWTFKKLCLPKDYKSYRSIKYPISENCTALDPPNSKLSTYWYVTETFELRLNKLSC